MKILNVIYMKYLKPLRVIIFNDFCIHRNNRNLCISFKNLENLQFLRYFRDSTGLLKSEILCNL